MVDSPYLWDTLQRYQIYRIQSTSSTDIFDLIKAYKRITQRDLNHGFNWLFSENEVVYRLGVILSSIFMDCLYRKLIVPKSDFRYLSCHETRCMEVYLVPGALFYFQWELWCFRDLIRGAKLVNGAYICCISVIVSYFTELFFVCYLISFAINAKNNLNEYY